MLSIVIIGGGASGIFCAANINRDDVQITILEKSNKLLSKVKISGGGRCNVTHRFDGDYKAFAKNYARGEHLLKKTLSQFSPQDTVEWFEKRGVAVKTEADGRVFPVSDNSQDVIDCLLKAVRQNKVTIHLQKAVTAIINKEKQFAIYVNKEAAPLMADIVVMATGGYPKITQFDWMQNLELNIINPVPSLFTFNLPNHPITSLMGVSVPNATVKIIGNKLQTKGSLLITHWGLSGPAILKMSAIGALFFYEKDYQFKALINWTNIENEEAIISIIQNLKRISPHKLLFSKNEFGLPNRLWEFLLVESDADGTMNWGSLPAKVQNKLIQNLLRYEVAVSGKTTFKAEFVTAGGIDTKDIYPQTMKSRTMDNLYCIGEALNVDGITGGFNFQHAWTSGYIVAQCINKLK